MKRKNYIYLVFLLILLIGCKNKPTEDQTSRIYQEKLIVIGLDDTFAPMGFRDKSGELVGFDIDLSKEVFKRLGLNIEYQAIDWSMKETELNKGSIDLLWNGYSITDQRKKQVNFTEPYLENKQIIITMKDLKISSKDELSGKKVAVQSGSSSLDAINKENDLVMSFYNSEPILFDTNHEAFLDLEAKRSDVLVADEVLAKYYIREKGNGNYNISIDDFGSEQYGVGLRKSDLKLLEDINHIFLQIKEDGTYDKIYNKWFK